MSHRYNRFCRKCWGEVCEYDENGKKVSAKEYKRRQDDHDVHEIIREGLAYAGGKE